MHYVFQSWLEVELVLEGGGTKVNSFKKTSILNPVRDLVTLWNPGSMFIRILSVSKDMAWSGSVDRLKMMWIAQVFSVVNSKGKSAVSWPLKNLNVPAFSLSTLSSDADRMMIRVTSRARPKSISRYSIKSPTTLRNGWKETKLSKIRKSNG